MDFKKFVNGREEIKTITEEMVVERDGRLVYKRAILEELMLWHLGKTIAYTEKILCDEFILDMIEGDEVELTNMDKMQISWAVSLATQHLPNFGHKLWQDHSEYVLRHLILGAYVIYVRALKDIIMDDVRIIDKIGTAEVGKDARVVLDNLLMACESLVSNLYVEIFVKYAKTFKPLLKHIYSKLSGKGDPEVNFKINVEVTNANNEVRCSKVETRDFRVMLRKLIPHGMSDVTNSAIRRESRVTYTTKGKPDVVDIELEYKNLPTFLTKLYYIDKISLGTTFNAFGKSYNNFMYTLRYK